MTFEEIEEQRDRTAGLESEELSEGRLEEIEAYDMLDQKHEHYYEHMADLWDNRDKTAGKGKPRPDHDPHVDWPERFTDGRPI